MKKGFTLIELLVTVVVLGILTFAIIMSIDPADRLRDARDVKVKNDVGSIANAVEAYQTNNGGSYNGATGLDTGTIVQQKYLKSWPTSNGIDINVTATVAHAYGVVLSKNNKGSCTDTMYWTYNSTDGKTYKCCLTSAPVAGTTNPASNGSCTVAST